jgi:small nuclear ribonucleoprotein (snRNP)-like protein
MRRAYRDLVAARLIVNTKTGRTFRGLLWEDRRELLVLRDATMLEGRADTVVDGEVVIERGNIDFIQVLPGASA